MRNSFVKIHKEQTEILKNNKKNLWKNLPDRNASFHSFPKNISAVLIKPKINIIQNNPQIIFFENGEITPFKILIKKNNDPIVKIEGRANGEIKQHVYED